VKTVGDIAALVGGQVDGDAGLTISGVSGLEAAQAGQLSFYGNQKYKAALEATKASAVLVPEDAPPRGSRTQIRVKNPHLAFARVAQVFHPKKQHAPGRSPQAFVHPEATVDASATIMAHAYVAKGAKVGARAVLYPGAYVGEEARVGDDTVLSPNVAVMDRCVVGARCLLHAGAVVGADGFGFALDLSVPEHVKIPQAGIARLEDDVELGACTCVDRATTGETVIGHGTKIDNLVQVGHNSVVGPLSILCAQVGLSGTTTLGQGVVLAGQVGTAGHLHIGDLAKVGAQAGVMNDVEPGATVLGAPAMPHKDFLRSAALFAKLPELNRELRELKKRLEQLEKEKTR
jgi:UDP-3-O-[3-hydroxymyristoyl] glucosamine N-acyltransferase